MADFLIDSLNEQQREIVFAPLSNIFVVAGAGTGKTRVLISRLVYLLEEENLQPWNILAVTFTNKAANEMEERLLKAMGWEHNQGLLMSTFHSFCYRILRRYHLQAKLPDNFSLITSSDQESIIRKFYSDNEIQTKDEQYGDFKGLDLTPSQVANRILQFKEQGFKSKMDEGELDSILATLKLNWRQYSPDELFEIVFAAYQRMCNKSGVVDFADLLVKTLELLRNNREIQQRLHQRYRYICVDEFQDTNNIQYDLLMALKGPESYVLVVGDDDQSIYGWRGANSKNLNKICTDVPDMQIYELTINYRSTQSILNAANAMITVSNERLINKFLINPECYELSKQYDIQLCLELKENKVIESIKGIGAPYDESVALAQNLSTLTYRMREELINRLYSKDVLSNSQFKERELFKWQRHSNQDQAHDPQVSFLRINGSAIHEGALVSTLVKNLVSKGRKYEDIAVLYRNNSLSATIEHALVDNDIPYQIYGGLKFYERNEIADVLSYMRVIANIKDDVSFARIINTPRRGIGKAALGKLEDYASACGLSLYEALAHIINSNDAASMKLIKKFVSFYYLIEDLRQDVCRYSLDLFIKKLMHETGLEEHFRSLDTKERSARLGVSRLDNINQLIINAKTFFSNHNRVEAEWQLSSGQVPDYFVNAPYPKTQELLSKDQNHSQDVMQINYENFISFLSSATLTASVEANATGSIVADEGVKLMTIHASKGLEFPVVIIVGFEQGILPSYRAHDYEEERRLAYVAFTRAQHHLFVTFASTRQMRYAGGYEEDVQPSDFMRDVAKHYSDFQDKSQRPFRSQVYHAPY